MHFGDVARGGLSIRGAVDDEVAGVRGQKSDLGLEGDLFCGGGGWMRLFSQFPDGDLRGPIEAG